MYTCTTMSQLASWVLCLLAGDTLMRIVYFPIVGNVEAKSWVYS